MRYKDADNVLSSASSGQIKIHLYDLVIVIVLVQLVSISISAHTPGGIIYLEFGLFLTVVQ